jgi:hypothetical protein
MPNVIVKLRQGKSEQQKQRSLNQLYCSELVR